MLHSEYQELTHCERPNPTLTVRDLPDAEDRLLLFGYDVDRNTFAVAVRDGRIIRTVFSHGQEPYWIGKDEWRVEDLYPNKRVYPEDTDADFVRLLRSRGGEPTLTRWDDERAKRIASGTQKYAWA